MRRILCSIILSTGVGTAVEPFKIRVVDEENGWPVPMVELTTTGQSRLITDNAGVVAFDLPEFMGRETWLGVFSHGYELPADGFGNRGFRVTPEPGGEFTVKIGRRQVAKRLGRLTGAGLFAESQKLGEFPRWEESGITGCDTVQLTLHRGKLFWLWGDTNLPKYPLGIFHTSAAVTSDNPLISLKPPTAIRYEYFVNDQGVPRGVAPMPGDGPTWLSGFVSLPDAEGKEHLVATYAKIEGMLQAYEFGLAEWNEAKEVFEPVLSFWKRSGDEKGPPRPYPDGHPLFWKDGDGRRWLYFNGPPNFRCPATYEAWKDRATWEEVKAPTSFEPAGGGGRIEVASAAVAWSGYRKRWVMILQQKFGKPSAFGEVWYLEAPTPEGPWGPAVKVATHENYTFYNVQIDWQLSDPDEPVLLFEGTYTQSFTDNRKTPRYDYNQMLYRLDLDDPALKPAQSE